MSSLSCAEWNCRFIVLPVHLPLYRPLPVHRGTCKTGCRVLVFSASASDEPVVTAAQAPPNVHALATGGLPTWFERLASALMFLLPLSEGIYRISLSLVSFCRHQALEFMYWCHLQHRQVSLALASRTVRDISPDDQLTIQTLLQMSEKLHEMFSNWAAQLANLSKPLHNFTEFGSGRLSAVLSTPESLWQIGCLCYMSALAGLAALKLNKLTVEKDRDDLTLFFRKPQIVTVSYLSALLMRMSWSPMEGMSELSLDLYWLGASLLTALTTGCALSQMRSLMFSRLPKLEGALENMTREVTWLAQLHRSFLMLDWMLCLISSIPFEGKVLRSVLLLVYWKTVDALQRAAESAKQTNA